MSDLGAELRALRLERRLGTRRLAARAGVSRQSVQMIESGQRRARRSMIHALSVALAADTWEPGLKQAIEARLLAAAGGDLATDTEGWWRYRGRHLEWAILSGDLPLWPGAVEVLTGRAAGEVWIGGRRLRELPRRPRS